jgi:tetratricopeptide (TPR) repeat protein
MAQANRQSRSSLAAVVAALVCLCLCRTTAFAAEPRTADTERAEAKVIEAKAFFKSALYPQAAASYLQAFAISHKPATLFNAARAYEEAKHFPEAIALFNQYIELPDTPGDGRREANARIAHDRAQLAVADDAARRPEVTVAPMTDSKPPEVIETKHPPAATKPLPAEATVSQGAPEVEAAPQPRQKSWLDWAMFASGDTLVAIGLLGYAGAVNSVNQANVMNFSLPGAEASYRKTVADARTARTGAVVVGILGAGLAGWGAWRLWGPVAEKPAANPEKSASWLLPAVSAEGAGVTWAGRF